MFSICHWTFIVNAVSQNSVFSVYILFSYSTSFSPAYIYNTVQCVFTATKMKGWRGKPNQVLLVTFYKYSQCSNDTFHKSRHGEALYHLLLFMKLLVSHRSSSSRSSLTQTSVAEYTPYSSWYRLRNFCFFVQQTTLFSSNLKQHGKSVLL